MNLRIEGQQLRFRLSKPELKALCAGNSLTQNTPLPNQRTLTLTIVPQPIDMALQFTFEGDHMTLLAQPQAIEELYQALPSREGIHIRQTIDEHHRLELMLEIDIRTQKRPRTPHVS